MKPFLCRLVWRDILASSGWEPESTITPPVIETWGWCISKDKATVKVASTKHEGGWYGIHAFPRGCVVEIERLKVDNLPRRNRHDAVKLVGPSGES
jgi:hypothetical protein